MSPELNRKLCETYPEILEGLRIECRDGWYRLIDTTFALMMSTLPHDLPRVFLVKEMYGVLGMGVSGGTHVTLAYVRFAEHISASVCELCGRPGVLLGNHDGGRLRTRCGTCDAAEGDSYLREQP